MRLDLSIRLLGSFSLRCGDTPITTVNTQRLQALLAYLLLHSDSAQPRNHLAYQLWPDSSDEQARTNLRNLFHLLRKAFPQGKAFLWSDRDTIQWQSENNQNIGFDLDIDQFHRFIQEADESEKAGGPK